MPQKTNVQLPSLFWLATDPARAIFERTVLLQFANLKDHNGDGHPVLVIPGLMNNDQSTNTLRKILDEQKYTSYGWSLGRNYACQEYLEKLISMVTNLKEKHNKKVSIIGISMGGIFAREIAKIRPDLVRQVITLASPFKGLNFSTKSRSLFGFLRRFGIKDVDPKILKQIHEPPNGIPLTCIYTRQDGIVPWEACLEVENTYRQNVQVFGSHLGIAHNFSVLRIIIDRLQHSKEDWRKFELEGTWKERIAYPKGELGLN